MLLYLQVIILKTILENYFNQIEIERSKFLGYAIPIQNEEQAKEEIAKIRKEHPKATHHCYAYILKDKQKSNDDGEPSGTAGIPILEIIKQFDLENVLVVVVRYFGGIKLGAGGLIRAYARSCKEVLLSSKIHEIKTLPTVLLKFDYNFISIMENFISKHQLKILDKQYNMQAEYLLLVEDEQISNKINDYMQGKIEIIQKENIEYVY